MIISGPPELCQAKRSWSSRFLPVGRESRACRSPAQRPARSLCCPRGATSVQELHPDPSGESRTTGLHGPPGGKCPTWRGLGSFNLGLVSWRNVESSFPLEAERKEKENKNISQNLQLLSLQISNGPNIPTQQRQGLWGDPQLFGYSGLPRLCSVSSVYLPELPCACSPVPLTCRGVLCRHVWSPGTLAPGAPCAMIPGTWWMWKLCATSWAVAGLRVPWWGLPSGQVWACVAGAQRLPQGMPGGAARTQGGHGSTLFL